MKQNIDKHLADALAQARSFGLSLDELMARLKLLAEQSCGEDNE